jgi:Arc/MetJ-type ribon-helix-helix transcriptional regulator
MPRQSIYFSPPLHEFIKTMIQDGVFKSFQDMVEESVKLKFKQMGIKEITKAPLYVLKETYTRTYTKDKGTIKTKPKLILTQELTQKKPIETVLPKKTFSRAEVKQSQDERSKETENEDIYEDGEKLREVLTTLMKKNKWEEAKRIADDNESEHSGVLEHMEFNDLYRSWARQQRRSNGTEEGPTRGRKQ